jgi:23S rRNA pseudouridine1911/1915/1917 synthase
VPLLSFSAPRELAGERLDKVVSLAGKAGSRPIPRRLARTLIEGGSVTLDGRSVRSSSHRVKGGEVVRVRLRESERDRELREAKPGAPQAPRGDRLELRILHREDALVAVDKPAGIPSEPTLDPGRPNVLALARRALALPEEAFLGLPHRLDRDTSGVLLLACTSDALAALGRSLEQRAGRKLYVAVVHGRVAQDEGRIESFLATVGRRKGVDVMGSVRSGGRKAISTYRVLERARDRTLVECALETGRTHQLRVHLSELGHPIIGDELYGAPSNEHAQLGRHLLHARLVELPHPSRAGELLRVDSPVPEEFRVS